MARALRLAEQGRATTHPNPRVGCVIAKHGVIVGEGWHVRAGEGHAEVYALQMAGERARGADIFVTLEPCSHQGRTGPCADKLIAAGVRKVWGAMQDPNPKVSGQGFARLQAAGIDINVGLMQREAEQLNRGFISRMTRGRPWVTLKLAASLDGRTAMASGESQWITSDAARADVHRLRAEAGAVLTSSATVLADDPALTCRHAEVSRQPDRIALDARGRVSAAAKIWNRDGARRYWLTAQSNAMTATADWGEGALLHALPKQANGQLDLSEAMQCLARQEINQVLVECGPGLAGALIQQKLVDEAVLYLAPTFLGHDARPLALLPGLERLSQRVQWQMQDVRQVGPDLRLTVLPVYVS